MVFRRNLLSTLLLASTFFLAAGTPAVAKAATVSVLNNDGPGEGFNDPTPRAPVGGNAGTTLGAQRLIAFQHAADIWGGLISSAVTIQVGAMFDPLPCNSTGAILGQAGPTLVFRDFAGALVAITWYPVALGNALHGSNLNPGGVDIIAQFNSSFGTTCAFPSGWYYGLDGNPPGGQVDFVTVLLHELGHGLGFLTLVDLASGSKLQGFNDAFMLNLEHHGASPADYPSMTDAQRVAASRDTGNLHWVGPNVKAASGVLTAGTVGDHVRIFAPSPQQPGSSVSHWDTVLTPNQLLEPSYTGPLREPGLERPLFEDIGWTLTGASGPSIDITPGSKNYGTGQLGNTSDAIFTVTNTGAATLHVSSTSLINLGPTTGPTEFSIEGGVNAFDVAPDGTIMVTVRFAPALPTGAKTAALRFASDDPDTPNKDIPLSGIAIAPGHDLAVAKITAPASVALTPGTPVTKPVQVQIQNRSNHSEVLPDASVLGNGQTTGLVRLLVRVVDDDAERCQPARVALDTTKNAGLFTSGPNTVNPKAVLTVKYLVTYNCKNAKKQAFDTTPGDYSYTATVHHEVFGAPDAHPKDDICPHPALGIDPNPDGTINDTGCGAKKPNGTFGNPVVTNVTKTKK